MGKMPGLTRHDSREFFVFLNYFRIKTCDKEIEKFERLSDVTPGQTRGLSQLQICIKVKDAGFYPA